MKRTGIFADGWLEALNKENVEIKDLKDLVLTPHSNVGATSIDKPNELMKALLTILNSDQRPGSWLCCWKAMASILEEIKPEDVSPEVSNHLIDVLKRFRTLPAATSQLATLKWFLKNELIDPRDLTKENVGFKAWEVVDDHIALQIKQKLSKFDNLGKYEAPGRDGRELDEFIENNKHLLSKASSEKLIELAQEKKLFENKWLRKTLKKLEMILDPQERRNVETLFEKLFIQSHFEPTRAFKWDKKWLTKTLEIINEKQSDDLCARTILLLKVMKARGYTVPDIKIEDQDLAIKYNILKKWLSKNWKQLGDMSIDKLIEAYYHDAKSTLSPSTIKSPKKQSATNVTKSGKNLKEVS